MAKQRSDISLINIESVLTWRGEIKKTVKLFWFSFSSHWLSFLFAQQEKEIVWEGNKKEWFVNQNSSFSRTLEPLKVALAALEQSNLSPGNRSTQERERQRELPGSMSRSEPVIIYRRIEVNQYIFSSWIDRANRSSLPWSAHASMITSSTPFKQARESFFFFELNQWRWVKNDRWEKSNMTLWLPAVFEGQALHMFVSLQTITGKFMTDQTTRNHWHTHELSLEIMTLFVIVIVITIVVVDDTYFGDVGEGSEWFIAHSIIHVVEFGWFRASLRRSLLRIDGLSSSRSSFVTDGLFAGTALLSSSSPSLRMKMYRMMAQRPSSPLKMMKNHTRTLPTVGLAMLINGPNNQPTPCVTHEDKIRMTHRFRRMYWERLLDSGGARA